MENREKIMVIDPKSGLERFIGNKKLYRDYLEKFLYRYEIYQYSFENYLL